MHSSVSSEDPEAETYRSRFLTCLRAAERDEREAINTSNIVDERTRGATKPKGTYREPGDKEGLPGRDDSGSSSLRTGEI